MGRNEDLVNISKHEVDFADLPQMFDREMLIELDDRFDYGEDRWFGIGFLGFDMSPFGMAPFAWDLFKSRFSQQRL